MKLTILISVLCAFTGVVVAEEIGYKSFNGYQVLKVRASSEDHISPLTELYENDISLDFWTEPALHGDTDIMVPPEKVSDIRRFLQDNSILFSVMLDNVGELISEQRTAAAPRLVKNDFMNWLDYQPLTRINDWLTNLTRVYPNLVSVENIGKSTEGRDLKIVKISLGGTGKPAYFIDATIHAREWISTATVTYIINELVTKSNNYWDILSAVDFYILPIINVDGYEFTHTSNRMWRKTRSIEGACFGVDANRNYDYQWNTCAGCSSGNACSETYRGSRPYSEPEADVMKNYILNSPDVNWQAYVSIHSYGQYFMLPWGYTVSPPEDYAELKLISDYVAGNISALYGTQYTTGSSSVTIYGTDGTSQDWAKGGGGFKYVYTAELRDTGRFGFLLPADQIIPTAEETWAGFQVVARHLATLAKN